MASDSLSGCHGDGGGGNDVSGGVGPAQEEAEDPRGGEGGVYLSVREGEGAGGREGGGAKGGLLQQHEADSFEVEVSGEAGGVPGPRGEAVRGGAEEGHVTGST